MGEHATPAHRQVGPVDATWLDTDRSTNPVAIESLMMLDALPRLGGLR